MYRGRVSPEEMSFSSVALWESSLGRASPEEELLKRVKDNSCAGRIVPRMTSNDDDDDEL